MSVDNSLEDKILKIIDVSQTISTLDIANKLNVDHQLAVGCIKSIQSQTACYQTNFIKVTQKEYKKYDLTDEGNIILESGSHEARIYNHLVQLGGRLNQQALLKVLPDAAMAKIGFSKAMTNGWIRLDKETKEVVVQQKLIEDKVHELIKKISTLNLKDENTIAIEPQSITDLKKRKLIVESVIKYLVVEKDIGFSLIIEKPETDLTTELLQSGDWKTKNFKEYNFDSLGTVLDRGHLHPLLKVREQFRQIFLEMGFTEMPTNNFVENCFWNFDTLVVPQAHPARDSQDTFFISDPAESNPIEDQDLVKRTKQAHEGSSDGSWPRGYRYEWNEAESRKNVLRTHTTAVSARMLYKLSHEFKETGHIKPIKFFSIDRVFRNETLDATHLAEFNQVEGVVMEEGLTLGNLMGVLESFFKKLGIEKLRFKPAYNPYTEPSMEIFSYHDGLKKWVEIGNSGVFRPEMLMALGLPETATAIAWGLSLERPTMIKYKINNIRELVGHKVNLQLVYDSPLCLF